MAQRVGNNLLDLQELQILEKLRSMKGLVEMH